MKNYILLITMIALYASCQFNTPEEKKSKKTNDYQEGVAKEVLQTSSYTYILLDIDGQETWIAGTKMNASVGVKYYYIQNMVMENFQSKELNRFFDSIIFAQQISTNPDSFVTQAGNQAGNQAENKAEYKADLTTAKQDIKIVHEKGITSIADIYSNKDKYAGTVLTVKGVITKYNPEIMKKNWIHLQDGTEKQGYFDLVITTLVNAKLGDTITMSGKIILDKDFGYGYKYDVLLEDAVKK